MNVLKLSSIAALGFLLAGCAVHDSRVAGRARIQLIGMSEVDFETCVGSPDQHSNFGSTDILTYEFTSSSSTSWSLPIVQGPAFSNGGNCRMTVRFDHQIAHRILYSGEKNDTAAPDAYCAPIVRTCLQTLDGLEREHGGVVGYGAPGAVPAEIRPRSS